MCEYFAYYMIFSTNFDISTKVVFSVVEIENIINLTRYCYIFTTTLLSDSFLKQIIRESGNYILVIDTKIAMIPSFA